MKYFEIEKKDQGVTEVWLNRPDLHNAFNAELIDEAISLFESLGQDDSIRLIVLGGRGASFCAGADLNWMKSMKDYSEAENLKDSKKLAKMFHTINECAVPVIGRVHGHALGGGVGLVSVCDYVVSVPNILMGFTEVRLGLLPAVISPYCISKIGESNARAWFLSGERFDAHKAKADQLDSKIEEVKKRFLAAGPQAAREAKKLIKGVMKNLKDSEDFTCGMIAKRRISEEGQEGMRALLEKDKPNWMKK
jgi:methylglutaconyl-CoA hydratase